jgi:hypothetical protein
MLLKSSLYHPLFEEADGGSGGAGDQGGTGRDNDPIKAGAGDPKAAAGGDPKARPGGNDPGASKWEAERKGLLADLQKERKARQEHERQAQSFAAERDAERRRVQALAGLTPKTAEETEVDAVRARFAQLFPDVANITKEDLQALREMREQMGNVNAANEHHWQLHGRQMLDSVTTAVAKQLGGTLSDRQANRIKQAYVQAAEADPEFLQRHEAGDQTLVEQFVKEWIEDWFEPARRKVTATEIDRARRVPSARDRSVAGAGGKKIDYNNPKSVEDALVASFKEHGGAFGE